jgi:SAM-dependent methyltransferase
VDSSKARLNGKGSPEMERTTVDYWNHFWSRSRLPRSIHIDGSALRHTVDRAYYEALQQFVRPVRSARFIEIGCGNSAWLPFFSNHFRAEVCGLDYSDIACRRANEFLQTSGVLGEIRHGDFQQPPDDWCDRFDVVYTNGLIEHFDDTTLALRQIARFAKPGGRLFTFIPNMQGLNGWLQNKVGQETFRTHRVLSSDALRSAHEQAGLSVLDCRYLLPLNLLVVNPDFSGLLKSSFMAATTALTATGWLVDRIVRLPRTAAMAPYIFCCAEKIV